MRSPRKKWSPKRASAKPRRVRPCRKPRPNWLRIETEARTLAKILNAVSGGLFPAVLEQVKVERGFETALGAALGEDLDMPLDRSAPAHWGDMAPDAGDPALPAGARPLIEIVHAPRQLARRLQQVGVVEAADGPRLQALLKPGQRLVSRDGALWRWDGLTASADAPTPAAQRLAQKNRLAELDADAVAATVKVRQAEEALAQAGGRRPAGDRSRAAGAAGLARRAASRQRSPRCAGARRKGGRRAVEPPRRA